MSNLDNVTRLKDLNYLSEQAAGAINELLINGLSGVDTADVFTGATSLVGGASGLVPAPAAGDDEKFLRGDGTWALPQTVAGGASSDAIVAGSTVLSTTPATVDGGMWYELKKHFPVIKIQHGNKAYRLNKLPLLSKYDYCVSWLPFDENPLEDVFDKNWKSSNGTPAMVDMSPFGTGKSVSITTDNYLYLDSLTIGGRDFTIDGWFYVIGGTSYKRAFEIWREETDSLGRVEAQVAENANSNLWNGSTDTSILSIKYNQWTHLAMVYNYSANTLYTYVNGVATGVDFSPSAPSLQTRGALEIFIGESRWHNNVGKINAYVSNFRIFDGIALWTGNFTPPTAADYGLTA